MRDDYWNVTDEQVIKETGKPLSEWKAFLDDLDVSNKKSNEVVAYLQTEHGVRRYWARTLNTWYLKQMEAAK